MGDHAESIQIDFDPEKISYKELLEIFWSSHNPVRRAWSRQYMSAIFYHSEEQRAFAEQTMEQESIKRNRKIYTEIAPLTKFYLAEDYHQKYYLQQNLSLIHI